ncbi:MAG: hypothetical protein IIX78_01205, partial [Alistipes sp.]|nr:hypothetical protein [Alistipes sp.]
MKKQLFMAALALLMCGSVGAQQIIEATPSTLDEAVATLRKSVKRQKSDVELRLAGGLYQLSSPIIIDESLGGKNGYKVTITAKQGEQPVLSGGVAVTGWEQIHGNLYKAPFHSD